MDSKCILLVEDNPDDELLTTMALQRGKIKNDILIARDGAEAIEMLHGSRRDPARAPQLVLLDLKLPKIDGLEVLRRIRADERTKLLPVVILTSSREQPDLVKGYQGGANSYVVKPVDIEKFREAIEQLGLYWMVLNEKP